MHMNWLRLVPTAMKHDRAMKNYKKEKKMLLVDKIGDCKVCLTPISESHTSEV
jgi:hypothetical protein